MKPMTKPPDYETAPIAEICAPLSGILNIRGAVNPQANNRFTTGPGAPERRSAYVQRAENEKGKQMTPEKMRVLQEQVDKLKGENDALGAALEKFGNMLEKSEKALKRRTRDLATARAKIKTLEG